MRVKSILILLLFGLSLIGCGTVGESINYVKSELTGGAEPSGGIEKTVPATKKYPVSSTRLRKAVLEILDEQGYTYNEHTSTNTIKTDPKSLSDHSKFGLVGAYYYAKLTIKLSGSTIRFTARFDKESNLTTGGKNIEYPEKENELRRDFFQELDRKFGIDSSNLNSSVPMASKKEETNETNLYYVQKKLKNLGYDPGPIDGIMGNKTRKAIMYFQKDNNLSSSGILNSDTIDKLETASFRKAGNSGSSKKEERDRPIKKAANTEMQTIKEKAHYVKYDNGIVKDNRLGLEWYAGPDRDLNWHEAKRWVSNLRVGGGNWRMPSRRELGTLYTKETGNQSITLLLRIKDRSVWSGEILSGSTPMAWLYAFRLGEISTSILDRKRDFRALAVKKNDTK